ncbi:hypothetical protein [Paenisporosarcina antarctica]|nr:hypothetical protein [Paenisporosarcina antarctica]
MTVVPAEEKDGARSVFSFHELKEKAKHEEVENQKTAAPKRKQRDMEHER